MDELPLFPLNAVLYPGGLMPLQIFEVRYLEMVARRHREGLPFGIVCLAEGGEVRKPGPSGDGFANEALHEVGTLARIDRLERPQPGLLRIAVAGTKRFRITSSEQRKAGLWVGKVTLLPDDPPTAIPDDLLFSRDMLRGLVEEVEKTRSVDDGPLLAPPMLWNDCGWVANRWSELLPLPAAQKQRFLTLESPLVRLELVADTLQHLEIRRS